ncbi:hypothetical protein [Duganella sp. Leaf126]|uniref:hypothetical protein n=1 Tax=Duganella sp. Leaf126 TaxID=1736266 RepID=UPI000AC84B83|nr:hypothetical protein [Duganella sp. Leaf126]
MSELEERDHSAVQSSEDGVWDSELVFNLFIEGEPPESIAEEKKHKPEVQVAPVSTETENAQESDDSVNGDFLSLAAKGDVNFYDKAVTDRLAALAKEYTDPECPYYPLIMQAKTAAKDWFTAEFAKKVGRYS